MKSVASIPPKLPDYGRYEEDWSVIFDIMKATEPDLTFEYLVNQLRHSGLATTCIEPIFRIDLWQRFSMEAKRTRQTYANENSADVLGAVRLVFHGTPVWCASSITKKGFLMPGENGHRSTTGQVYVPGIYCSPSIRIATHYGPQRIFMCAVTMGNCNQWQTPRLSGFDSGVIGRNIWVVHSASRIVPLCVYHLEIERVKTEVEKPAVPESWRPESLTRPLEEMMMCGNGFQYQDYRDFVGGTLGEIERMRPVDTA
jgi:Poly(ADP-ribose) polymerase catalytic domain